LLLSLIKKKKQTNQLLMYFLKNVSVVQHKNECCRGIVILGSSWVLCIQPFRGLSGQ